MVKSLIIILFLLASMNMFSQQVHGLHGFIIDISEGLSDDVEKFSLVKNGEKYYCGGNPCNGIYTDYYDKDKSVVRMTGKFKKGIPVDTIKGYFENGIVKYIYYPYKKKHKYGGRMYNYCLYIEYDKNGNCLRFTDDIKGIERKFNTDRSLLYTLKYNRKKNIAKYYKEYYPENMRKTVIIDGNKYEYGEDGSLKRHLFRKSEKYSKKYGTMSATFYFEEYDVMGNVSKSGRFYTNLYEHDQWLHIFPEFPVSLDSVSIHDFKEIIYPMLNARDVYKWDYYNNKTIITRYVQQGDVWVETETRFISRVTN